VPASAAAVLDGWTTAVQCGGDHEHPPEWLRGPARLLFDLPLDLNRADALALQSLPGIGPSRADAIVRARCQRAFGSLAELERVRGIGPRTVAALKGQARAGAAVGGERSGVACPQGSRFGADRPMSGVAPGSVSEASPAGVRAVAGDRAPGAGSLEGAWRTTGDPRL
jgi:hypothetical protein